MTNGIRSAGALPWRHALLALAVVAVWGTNFAVIRVALDDLPPLLFATLRFFFALVPMVFFLRRPKVSWKALAAYGMAIGFGQFGLLYIAMDGHISPGLASLVLQSQVFFTIGLAMALGGERVKGFQILALLLAVAGFAVIITHTDGTTTPLGLALGLAAAVSWAIGNHIAKASGVTDMIGFVVWSSLFAIPPLFIVSLIFEGPAAIGNAITTAGPEAWVAVIWQSAGNTMFGYAAWGWLLARHPAATIAPSAMLVPIFGMGASAALLGEAMPGWKIGAAALVMGGLALNLLWPVATQHVPWRRGAG